MRRACSWWFYGFLFIFIDFYVYVDLLPDPIGYYFIYKGVSYLKHVTLPAINNVSKLAVLLLFLSLPNMITFGQTSYGSILFTPYLRISFYDMLIGWLDIFLIFYIFQCMLEYNNIQEKPSIVFKKKLVKASQIYIFLCVSILVVQPLLINLYDVMSLLMLGLGIMSFIASIYFLILLKRTQTYYSPQRMAKLHT
ncbi:hypothetical protein [Longirhabdus pacifica]|uniref:hypothetical protein n=1 Tax=Longirhabdus pacifica TaxID=2305227 RepID=UPI001008C945|nr:hypothetical protein [Longirhabdus pacifica]